MKIMSADNDERPLFDGQWNFCRYRIAISAGVCMIQKLHAAEIDLARF